MLTQAEMIKMGTALAMCYAAYKFVKHDAVKAAALGVAGVIVARKIPVLRDSF